MTDLLDGLKEMAAYEEMLAKIDKLNVEHQESLGHHSIKGCAWCERLVATDTGKNICMTYHEKYNLKSDYERLCKAVSRIYTHRHIGWEDRVKDRIDDLLAIAHERPRLKLIESEMERMQHRIGSVLDGQDPDE